MSWLNTSDISSEESFDQDFRNAAREKEYHNFSANNAKLLSLWN